MRNLKKTLCLVLALVFILGLCTVGAVGVNFDDENEIKYENAVKAMAGLGIIQGDDRDNDGKMEFRPKDGLTRAEAAKIIACVVAGPNINNWPARQVFDDVPADHWAARYIAYCQHNNIINGVGDGKFDPNGKVTLAAVAKMLLAAAGYGKKGEFTGPEWAYNVVATAMQTKVLTGLSGSNMEADATREEMALLSYNTLLNVVQVVLDSNTNSYVPETINGATGVTLSETVWELRTDEGVIIANKSNDSSAKGTVLSGTGTQAYYVTEEDENPAILGHQVTITYRVETEGSANIAVAYFIDDQSTEVKGAEAAKANDADTVYYFSSGKLVSNTVPAKTVRATSPGVFVLNGEGKVIAYKLEGYFISVLTISAITGQATVVDPSTGVSFAVQAPAGAQSGDIVTVTHSGDIYSAKLAETIRMTIYSAVYNSANGTYTYNDGAIIPSAAELLNVTILPGITKLDGSTLLEVGSTYVLYIDSEGGCIGYTDKYSNGTVVASSDYGMLVDTFSSTDIYGTPTYYAQVVRGNGTWENLPISKSVYDGGLYSTLYKLSVSGGTYVLTPASAEEAAYTTYSTADPTLDFSQATYIWYSGSRASLNVSTTQRPLAGSYVYYTYEIVKEGTVWVHKVKSVWFQTANTNPVTVNNSYIYVAGTTSVVTRWVNGVTRNYYEGYLNGAEMEDLTTAAAPAKTGFATYSRSADGVYTLKYVKDGNGLESGVRVATLVDNSMDVYFLNNKLYVKDAAGKAQEMSLTNVKIVVLGDAKASGLTLTSVDAIQRAALDGYKITMTFVENIINDVHSIGGGAIYVTAAVK